MARLRIRPSFEQLERDLYDQVSQAINEGLRAGAVDLRNLSPRGVSPFSESLAGSWEVQPIQLLQNSQGVIRNVSEDALARMVGSPPGTFVDPRRGSPLFRWAASKGIPARAVARSILSKGTDRWRTGVNPINLNQDGEWRSPRSGVAGRISEDIRRRVMRLRL